MWQTIRQTWTLLFGSSVLFMGTAMLLVLIVLRAREAGFSSQAIGILQSAYQVGWLMAAFLIPVLIRRVGHIRVFGAVGAVGSAMILMHLIYIDEVAWSLERMVMGICTAGLMILSESWLNDMAESRTRGKIIAVYTILSWGTPVFGVWLLRFGDINSALFFILGSILVSLGVLPILITATRSPSFIETERFNIRGLYKITPLGVIGSFISGLCHGAFFASVALFATGVGLDVEQASTITAIALGSGVLFQWPIAAISDRIDRRKVLLATSVLGAVSAFYFALIENPSVWELYIGVACIGTMILGLYSQCIAHANDYLEPQQIVSASSTLVLTYGIGFAVTPSIVGLLLDVSSSSFFWVNGLLMATLAFYVLVRMGQRAPAESQEHMIAIATVSPYTTVMATAEEWTDDSYKLGDTARTSSVDRAPPDSG